MAHDAPRNMHEMCTLHDLHDTTKLCTHIIQHRYTQRATVTCQPWKKYSRLMATTHPPIRMQ
jgi:hypothetical protein